MLLKSGVDISLLHRPIRRALEITASSFAMYGQLFIITSTYEGNHGPSSLHYCHDAFDCRRPSTKHNEIISQLKSALSKDYDIVIETSHIHIEYDPKT